MNKIFSFLPRLLFLRILIVVFPADKVERPVSTSIFFLLPSGNVSCLHRIPCAETWPFYMGEPLTVQSHQPLAQSHLLKIDSWKIFYFQTTSQFSVKIGYKSRSFDAEEYQFKNTKDEVMVHKGFNMVRSIMSTSSNDWSIKVLR